MSVATYGAGDVVFGNVSAVDLRLPTKASKMAQHVEGIDVTVQPTGTGCRECLAAGGWWFHLRRCAQCGHVGCCDTSPKQHATAHYKETGHPVIASFEPNEEWLYSFRTADYVDGPELAAPRSHPIDQPVPGPHGRVPKDWESQLH